MWATKNVIIIIIVIWTYSMTMKWNVSENHKSIPLGQLLLHAAKC